LASVALPSEAAVVPAVSLAPQARPAWLAPQEPMEAPMDSLDRRPPVSLEPPEQKEPPACRASRPVVFRPKQKGKQKVQQECPRAFLPRLDEAAAFPQNRWS
jgi:hypothetical protein